MTFLNYFIRQCASRRWYAIVLLWIFFAACQTKKHNHLDKASSPYLKAHADNPVDWYEWGDEALALAKKENKPLLISIGYSSCHWCHQMEKESFMDTAVARLMNENFVCIKVDREERPDIDNIYSNACQLITGNSGWPLHAFALPDGKPFFAGTYYSKQSWMNLLRQIATAYATQYKKVQLQAQSLSNGIAKMEFAVLTDSGNNPVDKKLYHQLFENIYQKADTVYGGLKAVQKFPAPSTIEFFLQYYFLTKEKKSLDFAVTTLNRMACGGIYDQAGGGFSRYAVDSLWQIPHFEKMLYDNAQLISVYAHAYQLTGNLFFKKILTETCDFVQRELHHSDGGYSSSLNADTDEGEGVFYSWKAAELKKIWGEDYAAIAGYYNITENGNWKQGKNVLYASMPLAQYEQAQKLNAAVFEKQLNNARSAVLQERNKRTKPSVDDKVLTSWNALLIQGFADAYAATGDSQYLQQALSIAGLLENKMHNKSGKLFRTLKYDGSGVDGFLDDYTFLAKAYIRLYQLTFNKQWLDRSQQLIEYLLKNFYDTASGMFFYSGVHDANGLVNKIQIDDNAMPASNAIAAGVLYQLGEYFDNDGYKDKAGKMMSRMTGQLQQDATGYFSSWSSLAGQWAYGANEVAIVGPQALTLNFALQKNYLPQALFMGSDGEENLPLLQGKKSAGNTLIYVCTNGTCKRPVDEVAAALQQLNGSK